MIVRLMQEGQYRVADDLLGRLNEIDNRAVEALDRDDEEGVRARLEELAAAVRESGDRLDDADLSPSDVIVPPSDLTLEEARELFSGDGLIPDVPVPETTAG